MKVVSASEVVARDANPNGQSTRAGTYLGQRLFTEDAPDGLNFVFLRNEFVFSDADAFRTPRHRHTFAQVKFLEKGASNYAPDQYIEEGEIAYFPRMAYYGPQVKENCTSLSFQFGFNGEHQKGPVWEGYRAEALKRLKSRGTIGDGVYTDIDPATGQQRVRDGVEAVYEEQYKMHTGRELVFRPASYDALVLMRPKMFAWYPEAPGVEMKRLGSFYDWPGPNGDVRISMVRLSDDGAYTLSADRAQVAWTLASGLVVDGGQTPTLTSVYSARGEATEISGRDGIEVYVLEFPRLD